MAQDCTYGAILLEMMIFVLFYLSCYSLLAVGVVKVFAVYLDCQFSLDKY